MKLKNCCAIITGASQGFGFSVAEAFVREGANIMICARNKAQLLEAQKKLKEIAKDDAKVMAQAMDIIDPIAVDNLIKTTVTELGEPNILISNAGVYGPKGSIEDIDWDEWSYAIDVNLKGSVLLTRAVLPYFKKHSYGKIIFLSGGGATKPMPYLSAYAASKAAVVRYAETLAEETRDFHIDVNAIAPGALNTRLLDEVLAAGPEKIGADFYAQAIKQKSSGGAPLEVGAQLCVYLASKTSDGITGKLISAIWDPWQDLHQYQNTLNNSDIYTLRRIVPEDRGESWVHNQTK